MTVSAKPRAKTGLYYLVDAADGPIEEANAFLRSLDIRGLSPRTVRAYAFDLVAVYRWLEHAGKPLKDLSQSDLLEFIAHEKNRGAHPNSINRRLTVCRLLFGFWYPGGMAVGRGVSLPSPHYKGPGRDHRLGLHRLKKKRWLWLHVKVPRKLNTALNPTQVREFLSNLRRYRDIAIVHLMLLCGLRSREVLLLDRRDVSLRERRVRVVGKGDKERVLPMSSLAVTSIQQYLTHERPLECVDNNLFVCLQGKHRGHAMTPAGLRSMFRTRRKRTVLGNANPHRFRHTFGTDMARNGVSLPVLQMLMGHEGHEITLHYINLFMADVTEAYLQAAAKIQRNYELD